MFKFNNIMRTNKSIEENLQNFLHITDCDDIDTAIEILEITSTLEVKLKGSSSYVF